MIENRKKDSVRRDHKSSVFAMVFSEKPALLELYNAMNGSHYKDPGLLEINTLKNAVYMGIHNDVSFLLDMRLALYEHQSTWSPNLPFRFLEYAADVYSPMAAEMTVYSTRKIALPTPRFVVFYNGAEDRPERETLRLSDLFTVPDEHPSLELEALFININKGKNDKLLAACKTLSDYVEFTSRIRTYSAGMSLEDAVELAIDECIEKGILKDFLIRQRAEVKKMSIYEYNHEEHMKLLQKESYEDGFAEGKAETAFNLSKMGMPEEQIAQAVNCNIETVRAWLSEKMQKA